MVDILLVLHWTKFAFMGMPVVWWKNSSFKCSKYDLNQETNHLDNTQHSCNSFREPLVWIRMIFYVVRDIPLFVKVRVSSLFKSRYVYLRFTTQSKINSFNMSFSLEWTILVWCEENSDVFILLLVERLLHWLLSDISLFFSMHI